MAKSLDKIMEQVIAELETTNSIRDLTLRRSRELIRYCANSIRAVHRGERAEAGHGRDGDRVRRRICQKP